MQNTGHKKRKQSLEGKIEISERQRNWGNEYGGEEP
jgi:hypothetical protein